MLLRHITVLIRNKTALFQHISTLLHLAFDPGSVTSRLGEEQETTMSWEVPEDFLLGPCLQSEAAAPVEAPPVLKNVVQE